MKIKKLKYYFPNLPLLLNIESELIDRYSKDPNWIAELKFNGDNCLVTKRDNKFYFYDRRGNLLQYNSKVTQSVLDELNSLNIPNGSVINGELCHSKTKNTKHKIFFHTILIWNLELYSGKTFKEQRNQLAKLFIKNYKHLYLIDQYKNDFRKIFNDIVNNDIYHAEDKDLIEGLVLKDLEGKISLNRTNSIIANWMIKIRKPNRKYSY